jgi:hypothetical protein
MKIPEGFKMVLSKNKGNTQIEITRHKDPIMDNMLIVNIIGSKAYTDSWIIEKNLPTWLSYLQKEGYTEIKTIEDVESSKKNNKKKI